MELELRLSGVTSVISGENFDVLCNDIQALRGMGELPRREVFKDLKPEGRQIDVLGVHPDFQYEVSDYAIEDGRKVYVGFANYSSAELKDGNLEPKVPIIEVEEVKTEGRIFPNPLFGTNNRI